MIRLDCHSTESALVSLSSGLGLDPEVVAETLAACDEDRSNGSDRNPQHQLPEDVLASLGVAIENAGFGGAYAFHGSRVVDPDSFRRRGILPRRMLVDEVWTTLGDLADAEPGEWADFRRSMETDGGEDWGQQYRSRISSDHSPWLEGPYDYYVRECLLQTAVEGLHDYLALPEIVEDIAGGFKTRTGFDLAAAYTSVTRACIVKVQVPFEPHAVGTALWYLYGSVKGIGLAWACGGPSLTGNPIRARDVVDVEVLGP
jgi:hypothetical protein